MNHLHSISITLFYFLIALINPAASTPVSLSPRAGCPSIQDVHNLKLPQESLHILRNSWGVQLPFPDGRIGSQVHDMGDDGEWCVYGIMHKGEILALTRTPFIGEIGDGWLPQRHEQYAFVNRRIWIFYRQSIELRFTPGFKDNVGADPRIDYRGWEYKRDPFPNNSKRVFALEVAEAVANAAVYQMFKYDVVPRISPALSNVEFPRDWPHTNVLPTILSMKRGDEYRNSDPDMMHDIFFHAACEALGVPRNERATNHK